MNLQHFLFKSFGVLALIASALSFLSCRGPWLQAFPSGFVIVPFAVALLLLYGGITLLKAPTEQRQTTGAFTKELMYLIVAGAAAGGLVLTHFFHGNSEADKNGVESLWRICEKLSVVAVIPISIALINWLTSNWKRKETLNNP